MKRRKLILYSLLPFFFILAMVGVPPPAVFQPKKKSPTEQSQTVDENENK